MTVKSKLAAGICIAIGIAIAIGVVSIYIDNARFLKDDIEYERENRVDYTGPSLDELITYEVPDGFEKEGTSWLGNDEKDFEARYNHKLSGGDLTIEIYNYEDKPVEYKDDLIMKDYVKEMGDDMNVVLEGDATVYDESFDGQPVVTCYFYSAYLNKGGTWISVTFTPSSVVASQFEDEFWQIVKSVKFKN